MRSASRASRSLTLRAPRRQCPTWSAAERASTSTRGELLSPVQVDTSLLALREVVHRLTDTGKRGHIPYRNSKLTHLLENVLGGDSNICVICTMSSEEDHCAETLETLKFAGRCSQVETKAQKNIVSPLLSIKKLTTAPWLRSRRHPRQGPRDRRAQGPARESREQRALVPGQHSQRADVWPGGRACRHAGAQRQARRAALQAEQRDPHIRATALACGVTRGTASQAPSPHQRLYFPDRCLERHRHRPRRPWHSEEAGRPPRRQHDGPRPRQPLR